jgi:hypothetical protein
MGDHREEERGDEDRGNSGAPGSRVLGLRLAGGRPKNVTVSWYQLTCVERGSGGKLTLRLVRPA